MHTDTHQGTYQNTHRHTARHIPTHTHTNTHQEAYQHTYQGTYQHTHQHTYQHTPTYKAHTNTYQHPHQHYDVHHSLTACRQPQHPHTCRWPVRGHSGLSSQWRHLARLCLRPDQGANHVSSDPPISGDHPISESARPPPEGVHPTRQRQSARGSCRCCLTGNPGPTSGLAESGTVLLQLEQASTKLLFFYW